MPKIHPSQYPLVENTALPYIKGLNPIDPRPRLVAGSNVMTSWRGYAERRPGTSTYTADNYSTDTIRRFFHWQQWNGDRFVMLNEIEGSASKVYKQKIGTDATFQLIHTDSTSTEPFDFVVANNTLYFGNATDMQRYDGTNVRDWGVAAPATAPTETPDAGGSGVTLTIGRRYVYAYGNSTTGYLSDVSPVSDSTGAVSTDSEIDLAGADTTNAYIDKIHIFATRDGGYTFYELSDSPINNPGTGGGWTHSDTDADTDLKTIKAPKFNVNGNPTAGTGMTFFNGRIWWFVNSSVYYSGLSPGEVTNGLGFETQDVANEFPFGREVTGLASANGVLLVFTVQGIFTIRGDSIETFQRGTLSMHHGCINRAAIAEDSDGVFWLDTSNSIFVTNGAEIKEIGRPIRADIESITHAEASIAIHRDGKVNWVVLCDGNAGNLYVLDIDTEQWMPPWALSGAEAVYSAETAAGTWTLLLGQSGKPIKFDHALNQDQGSNFAASLTTSLLPVASQDAPDEVSNIEQVGIERNAIALTTAQYLADDDPDSGTYVTISTSADPPYHASGTDVVEKWFWLHQKVCRRISIKMNWAAANSHFKVYSMYVKAKRFGRR